MYHFSNICRVFDRKNKRMYNNLNIFKDIKQIDEDTFSIKGEILNKENLTLMLSTGFRDSSGNIIYEKDLIEYSSYDEKELIYIDDIRRVNLANYPSYKLDRLGSIYNKEIQEIVGEFYDATNCVEILINKCPFCNGKHVYYLYDKKLGSTCEVFHLGDYISEGLTETFQFIVPCLENLGNLECCVHVEDGRFSDYYIK